MLLYKVGIDLKGPLSLTRMIFGFTSLLDFFSYFAFPHVLIKYWASREKFSYFHEVLVSSSGGIVRSGFRSRVKIKLPYRGCGRRMMRLLG